MPSIQMIVTGDLEKKAIINSLSRYFPAHDSNGHQISWYVQKQQVGLTSSPITSPTPTPSRARDLANTMLSSLNHTGARRKKPPDLIIVIDDVELSHRTNPQIVIACFKQAINEWINKNIKPLDAPVFRQNIQSRCSLHLMMPMVESYFFGDNQALNTMQISTSVVSNLVNPNVENFLTNDPNPDWQSFCKTKNAEQLALKNTWWQTERHPKCYLEHLIQSTDRVYSETQHGAAAFENLDWRAPTLINPQATLFARSLFEDLCDWFDTACQTPARTPNPLGPGATALETYPTRSVHRASLLLRNI